MSDGEPRNNSISPYHDGQAEAAELRGQGVTIYSIGLNIGDKKFNNFIVPLASSPKSTYAINIEKTSDLIGIYDAIASSIKIAGTERKLQMSSTQKRLRLQRITTMACGMKQAQAP